MVGGSSLPGVGRVLPVFKLAANYTELPGDAPIRRCDTSETERRSVLDSGSTATTNTARTLLGNDAEHLLTLHRLDAFTAVTVPERSRL